MVFATAVSAEGPSADNRPVARGQADQEPPLRPKVRPREEVALQHGVETLAIYRAEHNLATVNPYAVRQSPRTARRPAAIEKAAQAERTARLRGQICGDPNIQGEAIGQVGGAGSCGIERAVRVKSVAGVPLSPQPTIDCKTATALKRWVEAGVKPVVGHEGGGVASLRVVSHYACRNRNAASTGRLSEHATGRAVDIAGIKLNSGREITVLNGWNTDADGARLRRMWQAACGPFGTVLGPDANRFHRDHFHFDTARYRSGSYCR
ncbi:extensin-like domain-containing protein [Yoonia sp. MH D7]